MAIVLPLFSSAIFFGILFGIGGAVLFSNERSKENYELANMYFTVSLYLIVIITIILWIFSLIYQKPLMFLFGATEELYPTVYKYSHWIIWFLPTYIIPPFLSAFLRNDRAPGLAFTAVIIGGIINIFGDYYFVFPLGLKIEGAAIATILGSTIQFSILLSHFFTKKNTLRIVRIKRFLNKAKQIVKIGLGAGIIEAGILIVSILMNNQIDRYGSLADLSVYGIIRVRKVNKFLSLQINSELNRKENN